MFLVRVQKFLSMLVEDTSNKSAFYFVKKMKEAENNVMKNKQAQNIPDQN